MKTLAVDFETEGSYHISMQRKRPLLVDVSLWSADLINMAAEIESVYRTPIPFISMWLTAILSPTLLFFPDMVAAIRAVTTEPLHVHLMVSDPDLKCSRSSMRALT